MSIETRRRVRAAGIPTARGYVTKLGAYGLTVAAAFAVALAVLVSVSSTPTAEAATVQLAESAPSQSAAPGDTVQIQVNGALAQLSITGTADGVGASFTANDGQSINCGDNASCDTDDSDTNTAGRQNVVDQVRVNLKIDDDAGEGYILVSVLGIGAATNTAQVTKVINVSKATLVGSLKITATPKTIAANNGTSTLLVEVQNASSNPAGLNDQEVSLITTLGSLECVSGTETQACSVTTADYDHDNDGTTAVAPGGITATLNGRGVEGEAVITARLGSMTATATVTMFGTAKNLTAEPMQGSVEIGGDVYVVLTVTDGAGNPVAGQVITPVTSKEVVGPGDDPVTVETETATAATTESAVGVGYSKDFIHPTDSTKNIPACGDDNTGSLESPETEVFDTDGTNADGKCVVHVSAPKKGVDGATKNATRGENTLNFQISATVKASAVIEVAGSPASITTDAPESIEPGSVTEITVSVWDDEDILVGITSVKVRKVGGDGLIEDAGDSGSEMTSNGQSKFTFIAPSTSGSSEILITAGDVNQRVTLNIGEAMEDEPEEPAMPSGDATLSGSIGLAVFSGGSLDDLESAALAHCPDGAAIYVNDGEGGQILFTAGAAVSIVNNAVAAIYPDGLGANTAVLIARCEADAMENEG